MTDELEIHERVAVCEQRITEHQGRLDVADSERAAIDRKIMDGLKGLTELGQAQLQAVETLQESVNNLTANDQTQDKDLGELRTIVQGLMSEMFRSKALPYGALVSVLSSALTMAWPHVKAFFEGMQ